MKPMRVVGRAGREDVAVVYLAGMGNGKWVEFVESLQPPIPREKKWVLIVSTLFGCPVRCRICDAGASYQGRLSAEEILQQVDYMTAGRYPGRRIPVEKFKVQFARMGEPAFNPAVLDALRELPRMYDAPGLMPCLSTIAPEGTDAFFAELLAVKKRFYRDRFQFQFSLHTTDEKLRDWLMPVKKWSLEKMGEYGRAFRDSLDRKVALNFALADGMPVDPEALLPHFPADHFLIKITPVNPTFQARENAVSSHIVPERERYEIIDRLQKAGYEVLLSIGELEENFIGSNCGQLLAHFLRQKGTLEEGYTYPLQEFFETHGNNIES